MFSFFKKTSSVQLTTDIHSHLIPGIDDGVTSYEEAVSILQSLEEIGITSVITTPHIAYEFYPNTANSILQGLEMLKIQMKNSGLSIKLTAAAEYYVDSHFMDLIKSKEQILSFGDNYVLVETPFLNKPPFFEDIIFEMKSRGLKPVFAHPERYEYVHENPEYLFALRDLGVFFQVTASSLIGYYSARTKKLAEWMNHQNLINFLGSDIHNKRHLDFYLKFTKSNAYKKVVKSSLLNHSL